MNLSPWIKAMPAVVLLSFGALAGCQANEPDDVEDTDVEAAEEEVGESQDALNSNLCETTYYSNASKTVEVGYCIAPSICSGFTTVCYGTKTPYWIRICEPCYP